MISKLKTILRVSAFFYFIIFISSCAKEYIQLFTTSSEDALLKADYFVFENDTVKITYQFWGNRGILSFELYNKLDKPIYINWENSSYIFNDYKMNYWNDEEYTKTVGTYSSISYSGPLILPDFAVNSGVMESNSVTKKPERITSIPPKSKIYKSSFYISSYLTYSVDSSKAKASIVPRRDIPKKKTKIFEENFNLNNSPMVFRNYIAVMFTPSSKEFDDESKKYSFIDNQFYVSYVIQEDMRHFRGKVNGSNSNGVSTFEKPEKKPTKFYLTFWKY